MGATGYIIKGRNGGGGEAQKEVVVSPADGTIDVEKVETFDKVDFRIKTTYDGYETINVGSMASGGYFRAAHIKFNEENRRYRLVCILNGGSYTPVAKDFAIYYIKFGWRTGGENADHWYIEEYSRQGNGAYVSLEQIARNEYNVLIHTPTGYAYANIGILKEDKEPDVTIDHFNKNTIRYTPTGTIIETETPAWKNGALIDTNPEDLEIRNGLLQIADRSSIDGLGYVILRSDKTFAEQVVYTNTIYEVRYNFDLGGTAVTIPSNCILKFDGGSISNGTLSLNGVIINGEAKLLCVCTDSVANDIIYPEWFTDDYTDYSTALRTCIAIGEDNNKTILFTRPRYKIDGDIVIGGSLTLKSDNYSEIYTNGGVAYTAMFRDKQGAHDITIEGLVFNQWEELDNTISVQGNLLGMSVIKFFYADRTVVKNNRFKHIGTGAIQLNGATIETVEVLNNSLVFRQHSALEDYDNSSIYVNTTGFHRITGNSVTRYSANDKIHGSIESHGDFGIITDNVIRDTGTAFNIVSNQHQNVAQNRLFANNVITGCECCFRFWPVSTHNPIANVTISNNTCTNIRVAVKSEIGDDYVNSLNNILIENNAFYGRQKSIETENDIKPNSAVPGGALSNAAIYLPHYGSATISITNNLFQDFPAQILLGSQWSPHGHTEVKHIEFNSNRCINCFNSTISFFSVLYALFCAGPYWDLSLRGNTIDVPMTERGNMVFFGKTSNFPYINFKVRDCIFVSLPICHIYKSVSDVVDVDFQDIINRETTGEYLIANAPRCLKAGDIILSDERIIATRDGMRKEFTLAVSDVAVKWVATSFIEIVYASDDIKIGDNIYISGSSESSAPTQLAVDVRYKSPTKIYAFKLSQGEFSDRTYSTMRFYNTLYKYDSQKPSGSTANRPSFDSGENRGFQYFDTTIGKPIYWTGAKWVDANGNDLQ